MATKLANIIILFCLASCFLAGAILYPYFPDLVASHWNEKGEVDGYMGKFWGIFLSPILLVFFAFLYYILPKIDPLASNIESFRKHYNILWVAMSLFFVYIFFLIVFWNLGYEYNFTQAMVPAISLFFFLIGSLLKNIKRNWFMGIRTPWTLSNDLVWEKTHKIGSKLFQFMAFAILLVAFLPRLFLWVFLYGTILLLLFMLIYSYLEYKKISQN